MYTDPLKMNQSAIEVLETTVANMMLQLQACEEQSRFRKAALECILYATIMPECSICCSSMCRNNLLVLLRTNCKNIICIACWRQYKQSQREQVDKGLPESICPYRSCLKRDNNGVVQHDVAGRSIICPCSIECKTTNNQLLYRIALTREKLQDRFETAIVPNVFSDVKPYLMRKIDFPDKRLKD